jgi:hypothetical protein
MLREKNHNLRETPWWRVQQPFVEMSAWTVALCRLHLRSDHGRVDLVGCGTQSRPDNLSRTVRMMESTSRTASM